MYIFVLFKIIFKELDHIFTVFLLFQSIRTPEECANWCNEFDNCHGFSVVRQGVNPDINRCSLKHTLTFPPMSSTTIDNVLTYYRLHGEYTIIEYKRRDHLIRVDKSQIFGQ